MVSGLKWIVVRLVVAVGVISMEDASHRVQLQPINRSLLTIWGNVILHEIASNILLLVASGPNKIVVYQVLIVGVIRIVDVNRHVLIQQIDKVH